MDRTVIWTCLSFLLLSVCWTSTIPGCASPDAAPGSDPALSQESQTRDRADEADIPSLQRYSFTQIIMGVRAEITLFARDEAHAIQIARETFDLLDQLEYAMSDYRVDSELMTLCQTAHEPVPVSDALFNALALAEHYHRITDGAFDAAIGPLVRLWREARSSGVRPTDEELRNARERSGWNLVSLDKTSQSVTLHQPNMQLDLGGIGKGLAAQLALDFLREHDTPIALVNLGGDLVAGDPPPDLAGWTVGLDLLGGGHPTHRITIANQALATSGSIYQSIIIDGIQYSHIVDPATGLGLTHRASVMVLAPDGAAADALASAFSVLRDPGRSELARRVPGVSVIVETPPDDPDDRPIQQRFGPPLDLSPITE